MHAKGAVGGGRGHKEVDCWAKRKSSRRPEGRVVANGSAKNISASQVARMNVFGCTLSVGFWDRHPHGEFGEKGRVEIGPVC